jgi:hypothetical protein
MEPVFLIVVFQYTHLHISPPPQRSCREILVKTFGITSQLRKVLFFDKVQE